MVGKGDVGNFGFVEIELELDLVMGVDGVVYKYFGVVLDAKDVLGVQLLNCWVELGLEEAHEVVDGVALKLLDEVSVELNVHSRFIRVFYNMAVSAVLIFFLVN